MGKFKYSMQNILDIKIKLETQAKNEFSEANRAYLIEKEKLEELFKKRAVYEAALKEQLSVPRQHHLIRFLSVWLCF